MSFLVFFFFFFFCFQSGRESQTLALQFSDFLVRDKKTGKFPAAEVVYDEVMARLPKTFKGDSLAEKMKLLPQNKTLFIRNYQSIFCSASEILTSEVDGENRLIIFPVDVDKEIKTLRDDESLRLPTDQSRFLTRAYMFANEKTSRMRRNGVEIQLDQPVLRMPSLGKSINEYIENGGHKAEVFLTVADDPPFLNESLCGQLILFFFRSHLATILKWATKRQVGERQDSNVFNKNRRKRYNKKARYRTSKKKLVKVGFNHINPVYFLENTEL
jgi:hypothetical protein